MCSSWFYLTIYLGFVASLGSDPFKYANLFEPYLHLPFRANLGNDVVLKESRWGSGFPLGLVRWPVGILGN